MCSGLEVSEAWSAWKVVNSARCFNYMTLVRWRNKNTHDTSWRTDHRLSGKILTPTGCSHCFDWLCLTNPISLTYFGTCLVGLLLSKRPDCPNFQWAVPLTDAISYRVILNDRRIQVVGRVASKSNSMNSTFYEVVTHESAEPSRFCCWSMILPLL